MSMSDSTKLVRPLVQRLAPYVPGEQPGNAGLIKLNTNENPYPPSPKVLAAIKAGVDGRLRLYPNPTAQLLREALARFHRCTPENIIVGNGSDEILALAVRAFVEPAVAAGGIRRRHLAVVQFFIPSYSLYPVLADIHGANVNAVPLNPDFTLPSLRELKRGRHWSFHPALTFITTPNAPSGCGYPTAQLARLCEEQSGVVVLDEAYVDFARENALALALKYPHVLVARTFSKAYSLCFQRVGYCVGHPELIGALQKIRDSYNVNGLGQLAALATLDDLPYYRANFRKIVETREQLGRQLAQLGFQVVPSQTNFILARPPHYSAAEWLQKLRERKVLVRWFDQPAVRAYLRITIGTPREAEALVEAAKWILRRSGRSTQTSAG
jgi:histidinol-phosphate aminotransferase